MARGIQVFALTCAVLLLFVHPGVAVLTIFVTILWVLRDSKAKGKKDFVGSFEKSEVQKRIENLAQETERNEEEVLLDIDDIDGMDGNEFENFVGHLLEAMGFVDVVVTRYAGDYGVDVVATNNFAKYAIQCKRWSGHVGVHAIQEALAGKGYYEAHVAMVVTNSYFTDQAKELARKVGVVLIDRDKLGEIIRTTNE